MIPGPLELAGRDALGDAVERLLATVGPRSVVTGWATVELDRAQLEVAALDPSPHAPVVEAARADRLLGARCRVLHLAGGHDILLLEPSTEGRLAAALARRGEGPLALYLLADPGAPERARRSGFRLSSRGDGPFGPERLVVVGPGYGPFLVIADLG